MEVDEEGESGILAHFVSLVKIRSLMAIGFFYRWIFQIVFAMTEVGAAFVGYVRDTLRFE